MVAAESPPGGGPGTPRTSLVRQLRVLIPVLAVGLLVACFPQTNAPAPGTPDVTAGLAPYLPDAPRPRPSVVFLQSWDGAPHHVVRELLRRGRMPNLARLRQAGLWAEGGLTPAFPSQTAPGHARLWTGAPERVNGITGNTLLHQPIAEHTILEGSSGFDGAALEVEPIWITAARQGKTALVWNAPQAVPYPAFVQADRSLVESIEKNLRVIHGYGDPEVEPALLDVTGLGTGSREMTIGSIRVRIWKPGPASAGLPGAAPLASAAGHSDHPSSFRLDVVAGVESPRHFEISDSSGFTRGVPMPDSTPVFFRLFRFKDGALTLMHSGSSPLHGNGQPMVSYLVDSGGGMISNGPYDLYLKGAFGLPITKGGTGEAEDRYLDTIQYLVELNQRSMFMLLQGRPWDLVVNYLPVPDEALHLWYGYVDKDLAPRNPALAKKVRRLIERVFIMLDRHLGAILQQLGPRDSFILASDHGMEGCDRDLVLNEALRRAGYLKVDSTGKVDLEHTKAYYGPGNSAWIVLNGIEFKDGIVYPEEMPALSEEIGRMLMKLEDPVDHTPLVAGVFLPHAKSRDYGGPLAGPIYVDAAPGVYLRTGFSGTDLVVRYPPAGRHMFHPTRPEMRAILYARGPQFPARSLSGEVSQLNVAPSVCKLLGIEPPPSMASPTLMDLAASAKP